MKINNESLRFIDLFCGCGGFSYGLEKAGHKCLLGVDFNEDATKTFAANHPHAQAYHGDIHKLTKPLLEQMIDLDGIDMVVGGPPCQGFSTVGRGLVNDERNSLFRQFVRIVKLTKPKIVLMENVTGIVAQKNRKVLKAIFREFEKLGYSMDARILSAEEYGVPERRRRTIIMGVQKPYECLYPEITHGPRGVLPLMTIGDTWKSFKASDGKIYNHDLKAAQLKNKIDIRRLKRIPEGAGIRYEKDEKKYLTKSLKFGVNWDELRERRFRQTKLQRLDRKKPAPTILTSRTCYYHPTEPRYLTAREAAACQSFDNDFKFIGSLTSIFRQIGNAVPPQLAYSIGETLKQLPLSPSEQAQAKRKKASLNHLSKAFRYQEHVAYEQQ